MRNSSANAPNPFSAMKHRDRLKLLYVPKPNVPKLGRVTHLRPGG